MSTVKLTYEPTLTTPHPHRTLTSCIMISFCGSWVRRPLACTASRFCHKLSERALFLSCSCNAGGDMTPDPATTFSVGERFSRCRRCSISCCLEVSRYSWYRKAEGSKEKRSLFSDLLQHRFILTTASWKLRNKTQYRINENWG